MLSLVEVAKVVRGEEGLANEGFVACNELSGVVESVLDAGGAGLLVLDVRNGEIGVPDAEREGIGVLDNGGEEDMCALEAGVGEPDIGVLDAEAVAGGIDAVLAEAGEVGPGALDCEPPLS